MVAELSLSGGELTRHVVQVGYTLHNMVVSCHGVILREDAMCFLCCRNVQRTGLDKLQKLQCIATVMEGRAQPIYLMSQMACARRDPSHNNIVVWTDRSISQGLNAGKTHTQYMSETKLSRVGSNFCHYVYYRTVLPAFSTNTKTVAYPPWLQQQF